MKSKKIKKNMKLKNMQKDKRTKIEGKMRFNKKNKQNFKGNSKGRPQKK